MKRHAYMSYGHGGFFFSWKSSHDFLREGPFYYLWDPNSLRLASNLISRSQHATTRSVYL